MASQLLTYTLLLMGVTLAVSADPNLDQSSMLRAFTISCKDCNTLQYGDATFVEHLCPAGTLCGPVGTAFSCIAEDSPDAASCSCGDQENTYIPEPYAPNKYIACLPNGDQSVLTCDGTKIFTGDNDEPCAEGPSCETAKTGFNALLPDCTKYFFCQTGGADGGDSEAEVPAPEERSSLLRADPVPTFDCPEGQVYDVSKLGCVDPCTLAPEPFVCKPEDSGPFADPEDCHIFHLCFNGIQIGDPIPCPEGQYYKEAEDKCADGAECPAEVLEAKELNPCYEHYQSQCDA